MNENRIHRGWLTGILVAAWWWAIYTGRIGASVRNPVLGIAMLWVVPFAIYAVCKAILPDEQPKP